MILNIRIEVSADIISQSWWIVKYRLRSNTAVWVVTAKCTPLPSIITVAFVVLEKWTETLGSMLGLRQIYCAGDCVEVLWPSQPTWFISSAVSLPNHTFTGQAWSSKWLTNIVHILLPETDNCPSWINGRKRTTVENISWSNLHERMLPTRRGLYLLNTSQTGILLSHLGRFKAGEPCNIGWGQIWILLSVVIPKCKLLPNSITVTFIVLEKLTWALGSDT